MLKISSNKRYLTDQADNPFLVFADTAWLIFSKLNHEDAEFYLNARKAQGVNLILCYMAPFFIDETNTDGEQVFTDNNLTPNDAYFDNVDWVINKAAEYGIQIIMCPAEIENYKLYYTIENAKTLGEYVGNRYKDFDNIIWFVGGDLNPQPEEIAIVQSLIEGIREFDSNHLISFHTRGGISKIEHEYGLNVDFNMCHIFSPESAKSYQLIAEDYSLSPVKPTILIESCFEDNVTFIGRPFEEDVKNTSFQVRRAQIWGFLSGGCGICYGNKNVYNFEDEWETLICRPAFVQLKTFTERIKAMEWVKLEPTVNLITEGQLEGLDHITMELANDGSFGIVYIPIARDITIDMTKFNGEKTIYWVDPANNEITIVNTYQNIDTVILPAPSENSEGCGDWLLVIE